MTPDQQTISRLRSEIQGLLRQLDTHCEQIVQSSQADDLGRFMEILSDYQQIIAERDLLRKQVQDYLTLNDVLQAQNDALLNRIHVLEEILLPFIRSFDENTHEKDPDYARSTQERMERQDCKGQQAGTSGHAPF